MLYLLLGLGAAFIAWISLLATRHMAAPTENQDWRKLQDTRRRAETLLGNFLSSRKNLAPESAEPQNQHPDAGEVYGLMHAGEIAGAVSKAEIAMASEPRNAEARLLLAAALHAQGDLAAATDQITSAQKLGAEGSLFDYLQTRVELEYYLAGIGSKSKNAVLMPAEMLALELHTRLGEAGDASALWLPGEGPNGGEVSKEEARDFVLVHFGGYYRLLETMIASQTQREYSDGLYLLGRLALKCGFSEPGGQLLLSLEEAMRRSGLHKSYLRDLALLRGEKPVTKEESSAAGKRVIKLKVIN